MANISGTGGCVKEDTTVITGIKEWNLTYEVDTFDSTEFADTAPTHKSKITGLKSATGTFSGNHTDASTGTTGHLTLGTTYTLNLEVDGTDKYSMSAIIKSFNPSVVVDGEALISCNFESTGNVTVTVS